MEVKRKMQEVGSYETKVCGGVVGEEMRAAERRLKWGGGRLRGWVVGKMCRGLLSGFAGICFRLSIEFRAPRQRSGAGSQCIAKNPHFL